MTFLNMSRLGVILQVRGRDGHVYTAEWCGCITVSHITYVSGWFLIAFPAVFVYLSVLLLC